MTEKKNFSTHRENAFLILFEASYRDDTPEDLFRLAEETGDFHISEKTRNLVKGVLSETETLDDIVSQYSPKRAIARIARVNLILLRMAIYELRHNPELPTGIPVSEAVHLSEAYASPEDTAFINGLLGKYTRDQKAETV